MMIGKFALLLSCGSCLLAASPSVSWAEATSADGVSLEEVVVTARRVGERLQDVPVAITAITDNSLRKANIQTIDQLQFVAPTLHIVPTVNGPSLPVISMRGQSQSRSLFGQDPSVAIYTDELVQTRAAGLISTLYDLDSIQVLRGPQGTLFGKNSTGGAVLFNTKAPTDHLEANVGATFTNYTGVNVTGVMNLPISDVFMVRLAANINKRDGDITNTFNGQKVNDEDNRSFRVSLLFEPSDRFRNLLVYSGYNSDSTGTLPFCVKILPGSVIDRFTAGAAAASCASLQGNVRLAASEGVPAEKTRNYGITDIASYVAGPHLTLKNVLGYRTVRNNLTTDYDGTAAKGLFFTQIADVEWISEEFQAQFKYEDFNGIAGVYLYSENGSDHGVGAQFQAAGSNLTNSSGGAGRNSSYAAFLQGSYQLDQILSGLSVTAGVRYTVDKRSITAQNQTYQTIPTVTNACGVRDANNVPLPLPLTNCNRTVSKTFRQPTYNLSLNWKFNPNGLVYVAHRLGYRAGGFNIRAQNAPDFAPFKAETTRDVEVGLKYDMDLDGVAIRTNLAGYYQWYNNIQRSVAVIQTINGNPVTSSTVFNAAKATIEGIEAEVTVIPFAGFEFAGTYAYTRPKYSRYVNPSTGADLSNNKFANVPENAGTASVSYRLPLDSAIGEVTLSADVYFQSSIQSADVNENPSSRYRGYHVYNARVGWDRIFGSKVDASAFIHNISNAKYLVSGGSNLGSAGYALGYPGDPRIYGVELRYAY